MEHAFRGTRPTAVVLGTSHWHAPLYLEGLARRFEVLAVQDASPENAKAYGAVLKAPAATTVADALAHDDIDVVFVFSPHHQMPSVSRALIARRIPFVIEKPGGTNRAEVQTIEEEARQAGVAVTIPLVQRDAPIESWLRQAGDIFYERMTFVAGPPARYRHNSSPWMLDPDLSGGGSLMNLGPHFVDMAVRHLGEPERIFRAESTAMHGEAVDDHATMVLTTEAGREAIIEVGYAFPDSPLKRYCNFTATGTRGFASVDSNGSATFTDTAGRTTSKQLVVDSDPLYDVFVEAVADSLTAGFEGLATLGDLLATMRIIWASESPLLARSSTQEIRS